MPRSSDVLSKQQSARSTIAMIALVHHVATEQHEGPWPTVRQLIPSYESPNAANQLSRELRKRWRRAQAQREAKLTR
jgi:hypothetical protein